MVKQSRSVSERGETIKISQRGETIKISQRGETVEKISQRGETVEKISQRGETRQQRQRRMAASRVKADEKINGMSDKAEAYNANVKQADNSWSVDTSCRIPTLPQRSQDRSAVAIRS